MNYFFGIKYKSYTSNLTIPKFSNQKPLNKNIKLYCAVIRNKKWFFFETRCKQDLNFFYLNSKFIDNEKIFFLASAKELQKQINCDRLIKLNNFTDTNPEYRCNFEIRKKNYGFSSYQSEYGYKMTTIQGSLVSSLYLLTQNNLNNFLIFKNIFHFPVVERFTGYIVDAEKKKILDEVNLFTNKTNIIKLNKNWIKKSLYFCTKKYSGIPIYLIDDRGHLSFEHTHPPQTYISKDKNKVVKFYKEKVLSIIKI